MSQNTGYIVPSKAEKSKTKTEQHHPHSSLRESVGAGKGGLFLDSSDG